MSKTVKGFVIGQEIPSNAAFLFYEKESNKLFYELPLRERVRQQDDHSQLILDVIEYLNKVTGSSYSSKAEVTRKLIKARANEGRELQDFKTVIDNKCKDWLGDPQWGKFLRPQTLFGNKFEGYLSQKSPQELSENAFNELDSLLDGIE
jgi:uncharacterized phage protein (TIGR02220 family)